MNLAKRLQALLNFSFVIVALIALPAAAQKVERPRPDAMRSDSARTERPGGAAPKADVWDKGARPATKPVVEPTKVDSTRTVATREAAARETAAKDARTKAAPKADVWDRGGTTKNTNTRPTMRAAQREAMRKENIPTSQQAKSQKDFKEVGRQYKYDVPTKGGGQTEKIVQRNKGTDRSHPGQEHVEVGSAKKNGQQDALGRDRLQNGKTKVNVGPPATKPAPTAKLNGK